MTRLLLALPLLWAATPAAQIVYGDAAPLATTPLAAIDGSSRSLADAAGPAGLVVVFWSNACPWTDRYAPRLADLVRGYAPAGVGFALVTTGAQRVSATPSQAETATAELAVPTLADPDGALAAAFGARIAPHSYFFGPAGTLLYDGAMDDSPVSPQRVRVPYLAQAMDQSVAGLPIEIQRTQAFGCSIPAALAPAASTPEAGL